MKVDGVERLVAGGASGLGAATARALHGAGAAVVVADLNAEKGEALAGELGERASSSRPTSPTPTRFGRGRRRRRGRRRPAHLRLLRRDRVGAAHRPTRPGPHDLELFSNVVQVNLIGTFNVLRLAAAAMNGNEPDDGDERGVCVNTASIAAFDGQIGQVAYSASKGGIVGMTLPAARDMAAAASAWSRSRRASSTRRCSAALPEEARDALGAGMPFPSRLGGPERVRALVATSSRTRC